MQKTTIYLPEDLKAALRSLARERGRSEADLVREAIAALTRGSAAPPPRVPLFRSGRAPIAERIDEALDEEGFGIP